MSWIFIAFLTCQTVYQLDTVLVTATRYPSALKDVAQAVLVIDRADIEARQSTSLAELLQNQAGIDIRDYGVAGSFAGINLRGVPSSGVLVLVDGQPVNSVLTGVADLSAIDLDDVTRVEIIKGPASSLYGANGLGGVVNVITRNRYDKPTARVKTNLSAAVQSKFPTAKNLTANAGLPIRDFNFTAAGGYDAADGFRSNSRFNGYHLSAQAGYYRPQCEFSADAKYNKKDYGVPGPQPRVDSLNPVPLFGDSTASSRLDHEKDDNLLVNLEAVWQPREKYRWQNNAYGSDQRIRYHTVYPGYPADTVTEDYVWQTYTLGLNSSLLVNYKNTDLIIGFDGRYDSLQSVKSSAQTGDTAWPARQYNIAGWIEAKKNINQFGVNPSLRLDRNSGYGYFLSPQIGMTYAPNIWFSIKASLGRAFRAPGFNDLYSPLYGNKDLKPEIGDGAELRLEYSLSEFTFSALSLFIREIKDRIAWLPTQGGLWRPENINRLSIRGLELENRARLTDRIKVDNEITLLYGRQLNREQFNADGSNRDVERPAAFMPALTASSRWDIRLPGGLTLNLAGYYTSPRKNYYENWTQYPLITMDTKILRAFVLLNAGLTRTWFGHLSTAVGCKNILDERYATQFGNTISDLDYPMPPRTLYFQLTLE
jgi:outer membrane cobalamin receptor